MQNGQIMSVLITLVGGMGEITSDVNMNPTCSLSNVEIVHPQCNNMTSLKNDDV
jgi:hypothetical protein